jgi:hypothetical protein
VKGDYDRLRERQGRQMDDHQRDLDGSGSDLPETEMRRDRDEMLVSIEGLMY